MRSQVVLQVNGDEPDGTRGPSGLGVLFATYDLTQRCQRVTLAPAGEPDAVVEPLTGGDDLLGDVLALAVNDGLRDLGIFAVGGPRRPG